MTPIAAGMAEDVRFGATDVFVIAEAEPRPCGGESAMILRV
ncbi:hypothetical protein [Pendulispora rubella]